ncbi:DUF6220 domain-containing protein [Alicyclobacillus fodiniaquatilis]|jgi:hypothetical protein|uniref:DUF6220 domain-containing protein n=1 Tax=Alicyclobacillus fodiniaquatilis TaxID=1661150 RepID=A0ABW4JH85_9BACL
MKKVVSTIHFVLCIATLVAVISEFLFAGMGVFHATSFAAHKTIGEFITYASLAVLLLSLIGVLGKKRIGFSVLLFVLMILQNMLVHLHQPFIAALHPLNGIAIMAVTAYLVRISGKKAQG